MLRISVSFVHGTSSLQLFGKLITLMAAFVLGMSVVADSSWFTSSVETLSGDQQAKHIWSRWWHPNRCNWLHNREHRKAPFKDTYI